MRYTATTDNNTMGIRIYPPLRNRERKDISPVLLVSVICMVYSVPEDWTNKKIWLIIRPFFVSKIKRKISSKRYKII
jgi:hypothetical protein